MQEEELWVTDGLDSTARTVMLVSGGLQQYLIRQNSCQQPRKGAGSDTTTFSDMPDSLQLYVFSFLAAEDLCRICQVCRNWYAVSCDNILWRQLMARDLKSWNIIGHTTNPDIYQQQNPDSQYKDLYLRCSPHVGQTVKRQNVNIQRLSDRLRLFWRQKPPRLVMFGPGLESNTSHLVRKILEGESQLFTAVRMFPGQFGGVGSGFTLRMIDDSTLDLITLYTATQAERQHQTAQQRVENSRLSTSSTHELQPAIKELCKTLDGLVYVVDSTLSADEVNISRSELFAMVNDQLSPALNPVVVLSCVPHIDSDRLPCIEIVRLLQLQQLNCPWQVHNCIVETMEGVEAAFHWLVQSCYRK